MKNDSGPVLGLRMAGGKNPFPTARFLPCFICGNLCHLRTILPGRTFRTAEFLSGHLRMMPPESQKLPLALARGNSEFIVSTSDAPALQKGALVAETLFSI
jgi:hypothetical protein